MSPRRTIKPHERGRKPCTSPEGPLVGYNISLPRSLKAWCMKKGPRHIRRFLEMLRFCDTMADGEKEKPRTSGA